MADASREFVFEDDVILLGGASVLVDEAVVERVACLGVNRITPRGSAAFADVLLDSEVGLG